MGYTNDFNKNINYYDMYWATLCRAVKLNLQQVLIRIMHYNNITGEGLFESG